MKKEEGKGKRKKRKYVQPSSFAARRFRLIVHAMRVPPQAHQKKKKK
jgi:hypothetical protein